jgi:hypothetical protein
MKKLFLIIFSISWCLMGSDLPSDTKFKAAIAAYKAKGFRRSQVGFRATVRDIVILQIREPKYFRGKELKIVLNEKNADFWNKVGQPLSFSASQSEIDEATKIDSSIILFESALRSVRMDDGK